MNRSYKYRLYPNNEQRRLLNKTLDLHRELYNTGLAERRDAWQKCGIRVTYTMQANQLRPLRRVCPDVAFLNFSSMQQTLRRLDKAFNAFFRRVKTGENPGYPRFKGRGWFKSVAYVYGDGMRLKDGRLYVQNVGNIRIFQHREIPDDATIKRGILKRDRLGNWFIIFQLELPDSEPIERNFSSVGLDMGLEYFVSLSTGEQIDNPRWYREQEAKIGKLQKMLARCKRGSRRYRELSYQLRKTHLKIANIRRDFHHKLSRRLVDTYSHIFVEDLNVNGLTRSHVAKSMSDAGWRQFLDFVAYKAENAGAQRPEVDARKSSQTCPLCDRVAPKSLSVRIHDCECGYVVPRDVASAQVVELRGLRQTFKNGSARAESRRKEFLRSAPVPPDSVTSGVS